MALRPRTLATCFALSVLAAPAFAEGAASAFNFLANGAVDVTGPYVSLKTGLVLNDPAAVLGVHGGYQQQLGPIVLGGEAGIGGNVLGDEEIGGARARAGVKVGYDAGPALPYLTGGYSTGRSDGAYYGVGVDLPLNRPASLGGEILHYDLDNGASATTFTVRVTQRF